MLFESIKKLFNFKKSNKSSLEETNYIQNQKSDGLQYTKMFDEEYNKMTKEEKEQTEQFIKELDEKIDFDNEFEISFEEKIKIAKLIYMKLGVETEEFKISNIEEINADFFLPMASQRGVGGLIIANDGTYLLCGSMYPESYYISEFKKGKRDNLEINVLQQLIEENSGPDPYWKDILINYFNNVHKSEKEKEDFLYKISTDKNIFNEFTKEISNIANADLIFEKYKTITSQKINNYKYYKKNDTDSM